MRQKKLNIIRFIGYFAYFSIILSDLFDQIKWVHTYLDYLDYISVALLGVVIVYNVLNVKTQKPSWRYLLASLILLSITVLTIKGSGENYIIKLPLVLCAFAFADKDKLIKFDFCAKLFLVLLLIVLYTLDFTREIGFFELRNGLPRISFGLQHPNSFAAILAMLSFDWAYIRRKSDNGVIDIFFYVMIAGFNFFLLGSRAALVATLLCLLFSCLKKKISRVKLSKVTRMIICATYWVLLVIIMSLTVIYNHESHYNQKIVDYDRISSGRISNQSEYLEKFGLSIIGQRIEIEENKALDSMYAYSMISLGALFTIMMGCFYQKTIKNAFGKNDYQLVFVLCGSLIFGIMETSPLSIGKNAFLVFLMDFRRKEKLKNEDNS